MNLENGSDFLFVSDATQASANSSDERRFTGYLGPLPFQFDINSSRVVRVASNRVNITLITNHKLENESFQLRVVPFYRITCLSIVSNYVLYSVALLFGALSLELASPTPVWSSFTCAVRAFSIPFYSIPFPNRTWSRD